MKIQRYPIQEKIQQSQQNAQNNQTTYVEKKPFLNGAGKIINGIFTAILVPGYAFSLFFGIFVRITLFHRQHFALNLSLIFFIIFLLLSVFMAIYNDHFKIPRLKRKVAILPTIGLQIIGRGQTYDDFFAVLNNMRNFKYPTHLVKKIVLAVDGNDSKNDDMIKVFRKLFPSSAKVQLQKHFSTYTLQQRKQILQKYWNSKYIIVSQPHGGRRQIKYTAFQFSSQGTQYVFHSDSDTLCSQTALSSMAQTAAGFNAQNPHLKPCGGVVGDIKIINVFNYFTFHMEISYWYAFNAGRSSLSAVNSVSTISGAMGLFNSRAMKLILDDYAKQRFLCGKIKCIFGEDRHLTSGLIINGHSILFDKQALALTQCPKSVHNLVIQQTRWYKGFYRQNLVYLPKIFYFHVWTNLSIITSFCLPMLTIFHIFYSLIQGLNKLAFFTIFVFGATLLISLRGILRSQKIRFIHALWHPLFYYFFLLPCKIIALGDVLFQDNKKCCESRCMKVFHIYVWLVISSVIVGYGFLYNIIVKNQRIITWLATVLFVVIALLVLLIVHWLTWGLGYYVPNNIQKHAKVYQKARSQGFQDLGQTVKAIAIQNISFPQIIDRSNSYQSYKRQSTLTNMPIAMPIII